MIDQFLSRLAHFSKLDTKLAILEDGGASLEILDKAHGNPVVRFGGTATQWVKRTTRDGVGMHEPGLVATLMILKDLLPPDQLKVFFDVGVLHGYVSLMAAGICGFEQVFGFEMNPEAARKASANFRLNPALPGTLEIVNAGVSSESMAAVPCLYRAFALKIDPTVEERAEAIKDGFSAADIDILSLDDFCAKRGIAPSVIKIDVEGSQHSILRGAEKVICAHFPVLIIESDGENAVNHEGISMRDMCVDLCERLGYGMIQINHRNWTFDPIYLAPDPATWPNVNLERNRMLICMKQA